MGQLHALAKSKFHLDEFYLGGFIESWNKASDVSAKTDASLVDGAVNAVGHGGVVVADISGDADQIIVDGAVNLTADLAEGAGAVASAAQSGRLRNYLGMAVGATAVALLLLLLIL